jgi:3'(2'), 5'-bisphosphate nucleotidase
VVASRRHSSPEQEALLAGLSAPVGELELANIGSSLKFCLLAEGSADCYPRLAPTSQWDTAAAQGVLEGAGGEVIGLDGRRSVIRRGSRCSTRFSWRCRPMAQRGWPARS